jgi:hypothetical protein
LTLVLAASLVALAVTPHTTVAAVSLALAHRDYPKGVKVTALPATNHVADTYFGPVHRTSFGRLGRIDGEGWIQAGLWHFRTGRGRAVRSHRTVFGYGIHVFKGSKGAKRALGDIKLKTRAVRVAHLWTRRYRASGVKNTLVFDFFTSGPIEVEAYYEYAGVAPANLQRTLRHSFSTQNSHLVALARRYSQALRAHPTAQPTATSVPADTPTSIPTETPTPEVIPTATVAPTSTPTPTPLPRATDIPTPVPTATPAGLVVTASATQPSFAVGDLATVTVHVTLDGSPVANATASINYFFPGATTTCVAHTDATGTGSCSVPVPSIPSGSRIPVQLDVSTPSGGTAIASTSFIVK